MRKIAIAAAAGLVLAPIAADAETICAPSDAPGYYACASVTVAWDNGNIVLSVQNLDSWSDIGMTALAGGYRLVGIGLIGDPSIAGKFNSVAVSTSGGAVGVVGSPGDFWSFTTSLSGDLAVEAGSDVDGQRGSILGCVDTGALDVDHFRTCAPTFPGMVTFTFTGDGDGISEQAFLNTSWEYSLRGLSGPEGAGFKCGPDAMLGDDPRPCITTEPTTVPEPATLLLLGTGLAGMFGLAWRRRRDYEG